MLRNRDAEARITVISAEHDHFFARTALMYVFCGQLSVQDTEPYDHALYERMRFARVRDRVVRVRPDAHVLDLAGGGTVAYDKLLLAVGSKARRLQWPTAYEGPGVHHFVTLQDLEGLDAAANKGMSVAVIGGGLIGVECAEVLHERGLKVHFLIREPWYFPMALDENEAEVVAAHMRHRGVQARLSAAVDTVVRRGGKLVLALPDGELSVDFVVGAIGVVPNTAFLAESGIALAADGAVETTDSLQSTNTPDTWAAGDCANVTWIDGSRRPEQLWYTARDQGRAAARAMLGDPMVYRRTTWYNSAKFFDIEYTTAGFVPLEAGGYTTWYQHVPGTAISQRIVCKGDRVVGFNCLGSRWDHEVFLRWVHERRSLGWVLEHMNDARFDEEFTPPFRVLSTATLTRAGGA